MTDSAMTNVLLQGLPGETGDKGDTGTNASASAAWPIGSVFIGVVATSPATLLGFGTWSAIAAGKTLVGLDSGDENFDVVEETGGAKTIAGAGSNGSITFTGTSATSSEADVGATNRGSTTSTTTLKTHKHTLTATGTVSTPSFTGSATSVVQPYFVVYMWKRTA